MMLIEWIGGFGGWAWIVAGIVLLGLELVLPGGFLVWLGLAGIATGLVVLRYAFAWPLQWLLFGSLSLLAVVLWTIVVKRRGASEPPGTLNRRLDQLVGREAVLESPIGPDNGRIALGDTMWLVTGEPLPAGTRVRIVGKSGAVLRVERAGE